MHQSPLPPPPPAHPRAFAPAVVVPLLALGVGGAIVGVQLISSLGVTPNTSLVGALVAMALGRVPLARLAAFRSVHVQNLAQTTTSAATFGAANSLLAPIGIPFLLGRLDLVLPMLGGAALAMFLDAYLVYRLFGSSIFPAAGAWPHGVVAADAIAAGDAGGAKARRLGVAVACGMVGSWLNLPMAAVGTAIIGNAWALTMFGVGLLTAGVAAPASGVSLSAHYVPHGVMIGAGLVALGQMAWRPPAVNLERAGPAPAGAAVGFTLSVGVAAYMAIATVVAVTGGLTGSLPPIAVVGFVLYAAVAAYVHELIVGLAAMHSGWFPAFAVALITLIGGMLLGFPPVALALLTGFSAATGPAFADMGYDLKAGAILRGAGDPAFDAEGRRQQFLAASVGLATALAVVSLVWSDYFASDLVPPAARVYAATIQSGLVPGVARSLALWSVPGALLQWVGGSHRQLGLLLATGLLVANPSAGWGVMAGLAARWGWARAGRVKGDLDAVAGGLIAGDALFSFGSSLARQPGGMAR
ncbi:MAG: OPT family oligopeptide transporter [Vicinamibacterales bacterium]